MVIEVCDKHMPLQGSRWQPGEMRNRFRSCHLDAVIAEVQRSQSYARDLPTNRKAFPYTLSQDAMMSNSGTAGMVEHTLPPTSFPSDMVGQANSFETFPPSEIVPIVLDLSEPPSADLSSASQPTTSASESFPPSVTGKAVCHLCSKSITVSNLQRHVRYAHEQKRQIPCPESTCKSKFHRWDNLDKHMRIKHRDHHLTKRNISRKRSRRQKD